MIRKHIFGFVVGCLIAVGILLLVERQTGGPRPRPDDSEPGMADELLDYEAIQSEREDRLTDSIVAEVSLPVPEAVQLERERLVVERQRLVVERQRLAVERDSNEKLRLLCRQTIDPRYCR